MFRIINFSSIYLIFFLSVLPAQQKIDFRTLEEQAKNPQIALKKALTFPGMGQIYNDQKIKGYSLIAAEIFSLWSFNENRKKYKDYTETDAKSQDYYLRERNRFAWIAIGLYFYGILDAVVESHLDNFDEIVENSNPKKTEGKNGTSEGK